MPNRAMVALGNGASLSGATTLAPPAGADPTKPQGGSPVYCADSGDCVAFGGYRTAHGAYGSWSRPSTGAAGAKRERSRSPL